MIAKGLGHWQGDTFPDVASWKNIFTDCSSSYKAVHNQYNVWIKISLITLNCRRRMSPSKTINTADQGHINIIETRWMCWCIEPAVLVFQMKRKHREWVGGENVSIRSYLLKHKVLHLFILKKANFLINPVQERKYDTWDSLWNLFMSYYTVLG